MERWKLPCSSDPPPITIQNQQPTNQPTNPHRPTNIMQFQFVFTPEDVAVFDAQFGSARRLAEEFAAFLAQAAEAPTKPSAHPPATTRAIRNLTRQCLSGDDHLLDSDCPVCQERFQAGDTAQCLRARRCALALATPPPPFGRWSDHAHHQSHARAHSDTTNHHQCGCW